MSVGSGRKFGVRCHTHNKCDSVNLKLKQKFVDSIFKKQEEKWVSSVKKLVSDIKQEILTEMDSACALMQRSHREESSSSDVSTTETLSYPLTLSELDDSSEVEFDVVSDNHGEETNTLNSTFGKKRKNSEANETFSIKRLRSESTLRTTPTHFRNSSPLRHTTVAKILNFSSCSSESEESSVTIEPEYEEDSSEISSNSAYEIHKNWHGMLTLDDISSYIRSCSPCPTENYVKQLETSPVSSESSNYSDDVPLSDKLQKYENEKNHSAIRRDYIDFIKVYNKSYQCLLETVWEVDEE